MARLSLMKFISGEPDSRGAIAEALQQICSTDEQVDRLSEHMPKVYHEWPGVYELRACACSMFRPKDGVNADSAVHPEGIPTPAELKRPELRAIPPAARRLDLPLDQQVQAARLVEASNREPKQITGEVLTSLGLQKLITSNAMPAPPAKPRTIAEIEEDLYKRHPKPPADRRTFQEQLAEIEAKAPRTSKACGLRMPSL